MSPACVDPPLFGDTMKRMHVYDAVCQHVLLRVVWRAWPSVCSLHFPASLTGCTTLCHAGPRPAPRHRRAVQLLFARTESNAASMGHSADVNDGRGQVEHVSARSAVGRFWPRMHQWESAPGSIPLGVNARSCIVVCVFRTCGLRQDGSPHPDAQCLNAVPPFALQYSAQLLHFSCILDCQKHDSITQRSGIDTIIAEFASCKCVKVEPRRSLYQ